VIGSLVPLFGTPLTWRSFSMHSKLKIASAVVAIAFTAACGGGRDAADTAGMTTGATTSTIAPAPMPPVGMTTGATTAPTTGMTTGMTTGATGAAKTKMP
jgi:hypothetical protein